MTVPSVRASSTAQVSGTTLSLTIPSATQVGDLLLAVIAGGEQAITTPSGWTLISSNIYATSSYLQLALYKRIAQSGDASGTVSFVTATNKKAGVLAAIQNADDIGVAVTPTGFTTGGTTTRAVPTGTSNADDSREFFIAADRGSGITDTGIASSSVTWPSGTSSVAGIRTSAMVRAGDVSVHLGLGDEADNTQGIGGGNVVFENTNSRAATTVLTVKPTVAVVPGTIEHSWVGALTDDGFTVKSKISGGTSLRLAVSADDTFTTPTFFGPYTPAGGRVTGTATGLDPNMAYYYEWRDTPTGGSETPIGEVCNVGTLQTSGTAVALRKIAFGGCIERDTTDSIAITDVLDFDPDYGIFNGDFHYATSANGTSTTASVHAGLLDTQIVNVPDLDDFVANGMAAFYCASDHETYTDNGDSNNAATLASIAAYETVVPHLPVGESGVSRDQQWDDGRVSFFMLDIRNHDRSTGTSTDGSGKTMLGADQKARLFDWLATNEQPFKVIVSDVAWQGDPDTVNKPDYWPSYATERAEVQAEIETANNLGTHVEFWHGDYHSIGYTDAVDNDWGGFDILMAAGYLSTAGGRNLSLYTEFFNEGSPNKQKAYGRITFEDDGTTITRTFVGWDAITETAKMTQIVAFTPGVEDVYRVFIQHNDETPVKIYEGPMPPVAP